MKQPGLFTRSALIAFTLVCWGEAASNPPGPVGNVIPDSILDASFGPAAVYTVVSVKERAPGEWKPVEMKVIPASLLRGSKQDLAPRLLFYPQGNRLTGLVPGSKVIAFGYLDPARAAFIVSDGQLFRWSAEQADRVKQHPEFSKINRAAAVKEPALNAAPWRASAGVLQPDELKHINDLVEDLKWPSNEKAGAAVNEMKAYKDDPAAAEAAIARITSELQAGKFRTPQARLLALAALTHLSIAPNSYIKKDKDPRHLHNPSVDRPILDLLGDPDANVRLLAYIDTLLFSILARQETEQWIIQRVLQTGSPSPLPSAFAIGIHFPYLYSAETLSEMVQDEVSQKPLAVLLVAKQSQNDSEQLKRSVAFFGLDGPIRDVQKEGYRVVVRELESACQLSTTLEQVADYGPVKLLIIAVHGTSDSFMFGSAHDERCTEEGVSGMRQSETWKNFAPESQVILLSCLTGLGRDRIDNVSNMLRSVLPRALVTSILAPSNTTVLPEHLHFDQNHHVDRFVGDHVPALYQN